MTFPNILKNPTLSGFTLFKTVTDNAGNKKYIEYPDHWECVAWPQNPNDPNQIPDSFHRDEGFGLAAGYMKWFAGYVQRGVALRKGQRYLAKTNFHVNMGLVDPSNPSDWQQHIEWMFIFNDRGHQVNSTKMKAGVPFGQQETALFVVEPLDDISIDFGLIFHSLWPSTAGEIHIKSIELLEVPGDYGTPVMIGNPDATLEPAPTTAPVDEVSEMTDEASAQPEAEISADSLTAALQGDDAAVIAAGLRAAADSGQFDATAAAGFNRLADVFERL